jgi:uncharacterized protein YggE
MSNSSLLQRLLFIAAASTTAVLAVVLVSRLAGPLPLSITQTVTQKETAFTVTGESEIATAPDQAQVNVGVQITRGTVAQAQEEANTIITRITQAVEKLGVSREDIKTTNYSIFPEYNWEGVRRITGYNVNASLMVKTDDFTRLNQIIDAATGAGANEISNIQFELSKEKREELVKQAREAAITDAKDNAQELAGLAGMRLGKIINVSEGAPAKMQPMPLATMAREGMGGAADTAIEPGSTTYTYTVTLSYETL